MQTEPLSEILGCSLKAQARSGGAPECIQPHLSGSQLMEWLWWLVSD